MKSIVLGVGLAIWGNPQKSQSKETSEKTNP